MALWVQNFPREKFGQSSIPLLPHFPVNCSSGCSSHKHFPKTSFKNLSLNIGSLPQNSQEPKHLGLQLQEPNSSPIQSTALSQQESTAMGKTKSHDQCISSESDESNGQHVEGPMKPVFLTPNSEFGIKPLQVDINPSMTGIPHAYVDPYYSGLFTAYGPQTMVQPQVVGIAPARVPLPLDLTEYGPIFVNAKQYHGILRRRQTRAKLEAQNKLVKSRRPYLHESRHIHALNRVRGSGGRFLSKKKPQQPDPIPTSSHCASDSAQFDQKGNELEVEGQLETGKHDTTPITSYPGITSSTSGNVIFQQPDRRFPSIFPHMQRSGRLTCKENQHCAPVVR